MEQSFKWPEPGLDMCGHKQKAPRGYYLYKYVCKPAIGQKLHAEQEPDNSVDEFAMKVVKKKRNSWAFTSRILANFVVLNRTWWKDMCGSDWLQTFSCSSKAKINRLKEFLKSKIH